MRIKKINEQFAQTFSGDGFNSSNGVFKVRYKSYDDLSKAKGREINPFDTVKGEEYGVGDVVIAKVKGKKIKAEILSSIRTENGKSLVFKIKSLDTNKTYKVPHYALEFYEDKGHVNPRNQGASTISNKQKFLTSLRYNAGNFIWGSLESKNNNMRKDTLLIEGSSDIRRPGIIDPSFHVVLVDESNPDYTRHIENFKKMGIVYSVLEDKCIYINKKDPKFSKINDHHLLVIEALESAKMILKNSASVLDERSKDILAAQILRKKGHKDAYRLIASNFENKHGISYGECADKILPTLEKHLIR
jgi:hypothetical protein